MRLRDLSGARDELHLAAIVQNLKTLASHIWRPARHSSLLSSAIARQFADETNVVCNSGRFEALIQIKGGPFSIALALFGALAALRGITILNRRASLLGNFELDGSPNLFLYTWHASILAHLDRLRRCNTTSENRERSGTSGASRKRSADP